MCERGGRGGEEKERFNIVIEKIDIKSGVWKRVNVEERERERERKIKT